MACTADSMEGMLSLYPEKVLIEKKTLGPAALLAIQDKFWFREEVGKLCF